MILPDANLLLYACDSTSPFHRPARAWLESTLSGKEPVGLCAAVLLAFVRLGTHPRVFQNPLTPEEASAHIQSWLERPVSVFLVFEEMDFHCTLGLLREAGTGGNLTTDAQIAALALRTKATVHSSDTDFGRFPGLGWVNPLPNFPP